MKKHNQLKIFAALIVLFLNLSIFAQTGQIKSGSNKTRAKTEGGESGKQIRFPKRTAFLNDFHKVLTDDNKKEIEDVLKKLQATAKIDFAVAIIESAGEKSIFDYSLEMARNWKIGSQNGGLLLVIAIKDRKWRFQIDKKLEQKLSEAELTQAGNLMREDFQQNRYGAGLKKNIDKLMELLAEKYDFPPIRFN